MADEFLLVLFCGFVPRAAASVFNGVMEPNAASKENHRGLQPGRAALLSISLFARHKSQLLARESRHRSTSTSALANKDISRWNRR